MVLWTDNFVKYLIGFSTIFWGASVILLWRFWNTVIPGLVVIVIAFIRFYFFPHNVEPGEFITGLYFFVTCLTFTSIISAYGYWTAYQLAESNIRLRETQNQLIQAEKTASMNMVVASIAHEINTPVGTAITGVSHAEEEFHQILSALELGEVTIDQLSNPANDGIISLKSSLNQLYQTAELVKRLKETAVDQSNTDHRQFKLKEYITNNIIDMGVRPLLKEESVKTEITGDEVEISNDPGEFTRILNNLITNSIYHGFDSSFPAGHPRLISIEISHQDTQVEIRYQDNGRGMTPEVLESIYDPFFTTRGSESSDEGRGHRGSGLGMSIVYNSITQKLNGTIEATSEPNKGAMFLIQFPTHTTAGA